MYYTLCNALIYYKHDFSRRYRNWTSELNIEFVHFNKMASETSFTALLDDSFSDNDKSTEDYSSNLKISFRITLYSHVTIYILMMQNDLFLPIILDVTMITTLWRTWPRGTTRSYCNRLCNDPYPRVRIICSLRKFSTKYFLSPIIFYPR